MPQLFGDSPHRSKPGTCAGSDREFRITGVVVAFTDSRPLYHSEGRMGLPLQNCKRFWSWPGKLCAQKFSNVVCGCWRRNGVERMMGGCRTQTKIGECARVAQIYTPLKYLELQIGILARFPRVTTNRKSSVLEIKSQLSIHHLINSQLKDTNRAINASTRQHNHQLIYTHQHINSYSPNSSKHQLIQLVNSWTQSSTH
jgi:hypothetical protein